MRNIYKQFQTLFAHSYTTIYVEGRKIS